MGGLPLLSEASSLPADASLCAHLKCAYKNDKFNFLLISLYAYSMILSMSWQRCRGQIRLLSCRVELMEGGLTEFCAMIFS